MNVQFLHIWVGFANSLTVNVWLAFPPKHACTTHWKPFLMHGFHSMPRLGIQRLSLKAYGRWYSCSIDWWPFLGSTNRQICWIQDIRIVLGWSSNLGPWTRDNFFCQFWKLGFCSVSECPISAHTGLLWKFLNREHVASISTWNLPKNSCMTHWNPFLMHDFHSMPRLGIQRVSLKAYGRWDSMFYRLMTIA